VIDVGVLFWLESLVMNQFFIVSSEEELKESEVLGTGRSTLRSSMTNLIISIAAIKIFCYLLTSMSWHAVRL
jgi:hypothetical protein